MPRLVGQSFKRVEDPRLITGEGRYVEMEELMRTQPMKSIPS